MPKAYHFRDYLWTAGFTIADTNWRPIWATTGSDTRPEPYLNPVIPMQFTASSTATTVADLKGAIGILGGELGVIGDRVWFYKDLDLRFNLLMGTANVPQRSTVFVRMLIITERTENQNLDEFQNTYNGTINCPILMKDWKVRYDKIFPMNTGYTSNVAVPGANVSGVTSRGKNFRFKLPFRYRASLPLDFTGEAVDYWQPPLNTFVLIMCTDINSVTINNIWCRQHFSIKP